MQDRVHPVERRSDPDGEDRADEVLALPADVEHAAAEREGNGEAGEDQRRRDQQRLLQVERRERALVARRPTGTASSGRSRRRSPGRSRSGFLPVVTKTTIPPTRNASSAVSTGASSAAGPLGERIAIRGRTLPRAMPAGSGGGRRARRLLPARSCCHLSRGRRRSSRRRAPPRSPSAGTRPTISPSYMTRMRSESERISSSSSETSRTPRPSSRSSTSRRWTNSIAPDVEAARRLRRDQHLRVAVDLAREHHLLLVAAGEAAGGRLRARRRGRRTP